MTWDDEDITSEVLEAIIQFVGINYETDILVEGTSKYTIRVTEKDYKTKEDKIIEKLRSDLEASELKAKTEYNRGWKESSNALGGMVKK